VDAIRHVPARFTEADARRIIERGLLQSLRRLGQRLLKRNATGARSTDPAHVELVWLPHYVVEFRISTPTGNDTIAISVETHGGATAVFLTQQAVRASAVSGDILRPGMGKTRAVATARKGLLAALLAQRGKARRFVPQDVLHVDLLHFPFWVYYHRGRRGRLDIVVIDAVTGGRLGAKFKYAMIKAFEKASQVVQSA
jgi:hypothetical protein